MRVAVMVLAACLLVVGCGSEVPTPTASPSSPPVLVPLPANISGIPGPADEFTATVGPHSPRGELEIGVARNFPLGHCGLASPIDVDGSIWDPISGHNGVGGPLTEDQMGELINSTPTVMELTDPNAADLRTPRGAVIKLARHDGPRPYFLCD